MTELSHHVASIEGINLHYLKAGQGKAVVLLHGWPQTSHEWHKIMPNLAEHYTAIAPDLPGLGDSDPLSDGYDKRNIAKYLHQWIQQLGFDSIYLVAHDMGVPVAYAYAALYPTSVDRLVILDVPPPNPNSQIALWHIAFHMIPELPEALIQGHEEQYLRYFYGDAYPTAITIEDVREYVRCYSNPASLKASLDYYRAFPQDVQDNIEFAKTPLTMPVLVLAGARSPLGNAAYQVMQTLATDVQGEVIADCGHWIAEEQPDVLLTHLMSFFAKATVSV
ncbi:alpha/beta fold hydrolase [Leptolyngbya sp. NIES-2104]|uniref:alpha/beta fold hydrolase n=1 Tax=Leptolyngbya sp. NIES-2104 TaxID=1552121 RepID=UPI0006EC53E2|nr:alpha/beta hydrolase [Leptolyngbya sp. NIES-2104]GAP97991.1 epoxide hydrolase [Leptolyngbya sp. NIES-2104]